MTDQLKIDEPYIRAEILDLRTRELALNQRLINFANQFQGKKKEYVLNLFRRIRAKEKMIQLSPEDEKKWNTADKSKLIRRNSNGFELQVPPQQSDYRVMQGRMYGSKFYPNEEYILWKSLLEGKEEYKFSENGESIDSDNELQNKALEKL